MGWFENQIKERIEKDDISVSNSFYDLSSVIMGKSLKSENVNNRNMKTQNAIEEICKYYKAPVTEHADDIDDFNEQMEYLLRPSGIIRRRIKLEDRWWKDSMGALLGETKNGDVVALIPSLKGYSFYDYDTKKRLRVTGKTAALLKEDAVCFYKPLPNVPIDTKGLIKFIFSGLSKSDNMMISAAALFVTLIGMFLPFITNMIFSEIIPSGNDILILSVGLLLFGTTVSSFCIKITRNLLQTKVINKLDVLLQSAVMGRVINLPAQFFKDHSAGELNGRIQTLNTFCSTICEVIYGTGLAALFSIIYLVQIISIAPSLVLPSIVAIVLQLVIAFIGVYINLKLIRKQITFRTRVGGVIYALFSGIQKIKLGGCEKRAFNKWAGAYKEQAEVTYNPSVFIKIQKALQNAAILCGTWLICVFAAKAGISAPQYMAFNSAFGLVNGAMMSLVGMASALAAAKPMLEAAAPVLMAVPEVSENKKIVKSLNGAIELNNVSFRYTEDSPMIIDNLSLKIQKGQYIAIVGKTGCGKSTLMRMLLGFEKPKTGAIYYDGTDVSKIDMKSLRRFMGVVLQNGKLFQGDIYSNIVISAPMLSLEDAWQAAEMAGVAEDIRNMPMGMHTIISEGAGGISGGQRQRIMIARAIAPKPKVLMFDEATSALDNITQKQVSQSMSSLKCTRIVIAHRLSTIKECDRIIVLDRGKIVEDGTYEQLVEIGGVFAELVERQKLDA